MKSFRFARVTRIATLSLALLAGVANAEDPLPPPMGSESEIPSISDPEPQPFPDDSLTQPADDGVLPDPIGGPSVSPSNQVNPDLESDDIFLPTPAVRDGVNYAPVGPAVSLSDNDDNVNAMSNRPMFLLHGGISQRSYATTAVPNAVTGYSVGASVRIMNVAQTVFLHLYGNYSSFKIGDVGPYKDVRDTTIHLGPLLEVGVGRRISVYGGLLRRSNTIAALVRPGASADTVYLTNIDEDTAFKPAVGAQYDFWVVPHGSMGVRLHLEQDIGYVALTMALEPAPPKKFNLNFESMGD